MTPSLRIRPLLSAFLAFSLPLIANSAEISAELRAALEGADGPVRVLVVAKKAEVPLGFAGDEKPDRKTMADASTQSIRELLSTPRDFGFAGEASKLPTAYLWACNAVAADVDAATVQSLATDASVERIVLDRTLPVLFTQPELFDDAEAAQTQEKEDPLWHLKKVGTAEVRRKGFTGAGVRVGIIDTGIQADHPELEGKVERFIDFTTMTVEDGKLVGTPGTKPYDDNGHGTHCAGTIAGNKVGIAPDAKLLISKSMGGEGGGSMVGLLLGMQWMMDPDGNPATADQPDLVSNSWGVNVTLLGEDVGLFTDLVDAWREAGIMPIFAAGNDGPNTAAAPAIYPQSFAVGATTSADAIASFSTGIKLELEGGLLIKPDISAPGQSIVSSYPGGKYARLDGTSMACPLVAGAAALAKGAFPNATISQLQVAMMKTSLELGKPGKDDRFGHGRLDIAKAFKNLEKIFGAPTAD